MTKQSTEPPGALSPEQRGVEVHLGVEIVTSQKFEDGWHGAYLSRRVVLPAIPAAGTLIFLGPADADPYVPGLAVSRVSFYVGDVDARISVECERLLYIVGADHIGFAGLRQVGFRGVLGLIQLGDMRCHCDAFLRHLRAREQRWQRARRKETGQGNKRAAAHARRRQ